MSKIKKKEHDLPSTKKRPLIADMFKEQLTDKVRSLIEKHGKMVPVPHNMTNYFQPLNFTINQIM